MGRILSYTLVVGLCLYQISAHAALYRGDIFGTVQTLSDAGGPPSLKTSPFNIGDPFQLTLQVNTNQLTDITSGTYWSNPLGLTLTLNIGGFQGAFGNFGLWMLNNDSGIGDRFQIATGLSDPSNVFNGLGRSNVYIDLWGPNIPLTGVGLQQSFSFLDFTTNRTLHMDANNSQYSANLTMTGGSYGVAVPIPPAILLLASGLLTLWRPRFRNHMRS